MAKPVKKRPAAEQAFLNYYELGDAHGCPTDQIQNFFKAQVFLQPKQLDMASAARACDYRCQGCESKYKAGETLPEACEQCGPTMVGVGGARGGSKSHWMFSQLCADDAQRYPGLKILYLRKSVTAAREQIRGLLLAICKAIPHNYREQAGTIEFPNGSYIMVKHFKDEKDIENFLGQEYDIIAIEELTTLTHEKWKNLMTCLRSSKQGWRPRFYAAWNWGGTGHQFVMRLFYEPWENKTQRQTRYILATVEDNKYNNPEYVNTLKSLTGWKYKSWYLGDPHFQAGQFFTTWDERHHVLESYDERQIIRWYGGFDYGWTHPTVFLLAGEDRAGNLIVLEEHGMSQTTIDEHCQYIFQILGRRNMRPSDLDWIAAGRDCFSSKEDGTTISDSYNACGVNLSPAEVDRINGFAKVQARFGDPEKGFKPSLFVHRRCRNLIAQIPMAQHHEKRPEDVEKMNASADGDGSDGDDYIESLRNLVATNPYHGIRFIEAASLTKYGARRLIEA